MKKVALLVCLILVISCKNENQATQEELDPNVVLQTPAQLGKSIFEGKGNCAACHKINEMLIGPSIQDIAKIYKEQNGDMISFLKYDAKPIVDPSQYEVMKTNFEITKAMSDKELKGLEAYMYSDFK